MFMRRRILKFTLIFLAATVLLSCGGAEERKAKYMERAKAFLADKNYDKSRIELKNVLQIDPKYAEAYFLMGEVDEKKQDMNNAFADYSKVVELNPDHEQAREKLARFYLMAMQPEKAKEMTDYILKKKPNDPEAKTINAVMLTQKKDLDGALRLVSEVVKANPKQIEAVAMMSAIQKLKGDTDRAIIVLVDGIAGNPKDVNLRAALAQLYIDKKDYIRAAETRLEIVALEPDVLRHRVDLAALYSQSDQPEKAEQVLRDAIKADPKDSQRYLLLADFLVAHDRPDQAESEIQRAIESYPKEMGLRFALARYYKSVKKIDLAKNIYKTIIDLNVAGPEGMQARTLLAEVLLDEKKFDEASQLVALVLKENAGDAQALLVRGKVALTRDKPDIQSAITDFRTILKSQPDSVDVLTLLAQAHQLNHEPDLARESLQKAAKAAPKDANAIIRYAQFLMSNDNDFDSTEKVLNDFLSANPDHLLMLQAKLEFLRRKNDDNGIVELLARMKKVAPDKPVGYYRAGEFHASQGKYQEALREFEQARDRSKGDFAAVEAIANVYLKTGKPEAALKELNQYLTVSPKSLEAFQLKATVLGSMNDSAGLLKVVDDLKRIFPEKAYGYSLAGEFYLRQKNYDKALGEFMAGHEKSPGDGRIAKSIVSTYLAEQKPDEAMAWLDKRAKGTPDDGYIPYLMGEVLLSQKKYDQAEVEFLKSLKLMPEIDETYIMLAEVSVRQDKPDGAIDVLKEGLEVKPGSEKLLARLASAYEVSGKYDDAILIYEQMLKKTPGMAIAANNLASILTDQKGDKASLERALQLAAPFEYSNQPALLDTLGWVYYRLNDYSRAIPLLKKAVDAAPKSSVLHYHLGMAYYKMDDKAAAKAELTRAFATEVKFAGQDEGREILKSLQ